MSVNFTSSVPSFKAEFKNSLQTVPTVPIGSNNVQENDTYCTNEQPEQQEQSTKKKGFFSRAKDGFINFRKGIINLTKMSLGAIKGAFWGTLAAGAVLAVDGIKNLSKQSAMTKKIMAELANVKGQESLEALQAMAKNMPKKFSTKGMIFAGVAATAIVAGHLIKAKLDANEEKAKLDHRWETGHNS